MKQLAATLESLALDPELIENIVKLENLFLKWNASINLSAARTLPEVDEHVRDSLHVVPHLRTAERVLDVGSGGGFPVAVAAICLPATVFTALEPTHKKHAFLRTAARELSLVNLEALAVRVEDHDVHDYDAATSRATFDLAEWLPLGLTLVRPGGVAIGFEAVRRDDLPGDIQRHPYVLDGKQRSIITVQRPSP